jgi:hypothetical protein
VSGGWSWARVEATCQQLFEALDWRALGKIYFHADGEQRWAALRPRVLTLGIDWARALLRRLPPTGTSLYVGAGIAELPVLLAERLVRGRTVWPVNRRARECEVITDGLRRAGLAHELSMREGDAAQVALAGGYDHLGCVSLFTDPQAWPLLSGVAYGRIAPVLLDVDAFVRQRQDARVLAERLFAGLRRPGWITTSVDEVAWFAEQASAAGTTLVADDDTVPTAVVGDPISFLRVGGTASTS